MGSCVARTHRHRQTHTHTQANRRTCSGRTWYKPQVDSFHMWRNPRRHGSQGAERAVDLAGDVAGTRVGTGESRAWASAQQNQHHGEGSAGRPPGHLAGVSGPWAPAWGEAGGEARSPSGIAGARVLHGVWPVRPAHGVCPCVLVLSLPRPPGTEASDLSNS